MNKFNYLCIFLMAFLVGCATTQKNDYAEYVEDYEQKLTIYAQYELTYIDFVKGQEVRRTEPFALNRKFSLPKTTTDLALGLYIGNPRGTYYEVWEEYEVLYNKTNEPYHIKRRLDKLELPEKVLRITLPRQHGADYIYKVKLMDAVGNVLFRMGNAEYSVSREENQK